MLRLSHRGSCESGDFLCYCSLESIIDPLVLKGLIEAASVLALSD